MVKVLHFYAGLFYLDFLIPCIIFILQSRGETDKFTGLF